MNAQRILVPTDFSPSADTARRQAIELAVAASARIDVFHAVSMFDTDAQALRLSLEDYIKGLEKEVFTELNEQAAMVRARGVSVEVSLSRTTSTWHAIIDKAAEIDADLIVLGTQGRRGLSRWILGSVAENVVRHGPCPVLSVHEDTKVLNHSPRRPLVPVDFSPYSERVVPIVGSLTDPDVELVLHHVVSSPIHPSFYAGGIESHFQLDPDLPDRVRSKLEDLLDGRVGKCVVSEGDVVKEILRVADQENADSIILATQGLTGLEGLLLGSVAAGVVRGAKVPVITLPPRSDE